MLDDRADAACQAGLLDQARALGQAMIDQAAYHYEPGRRRHDGHRLLGHVALDRGDETAALRHLAQAGQGWTNARSVLGPPFCLAQALLERGHRDAVVAHLREVRERWSRGWDKIDGLLNEIGRGDTPDLTARRRKAGNG